MRRRRGAPPAPARTSAPRQSRVIARAVRPALLTRDRRAADTRLVGPVVVHGRRPAAHVHTGASTGAGSPAGGLHSGDDHLARRTPRGVVSARRVHPRGSSRGRVLAGGSAQPPAARDVATADARRVREHDHPADRPLVGTQRGQVVSRPGGPEPLLGGPRLGHPCGCGQTSVDDGRGRVALGCCRPTYVRCAPGTCRRRGSATVSRSPRRHARSWTCDVSSPARAA
jgi:hypothetical protein